MSIGKEEQEAVLRVMDRGILSGYKENLCPVCEKVEENIVLAWLREVI